VITTLANTGIRFSKWSVLPLTPAAGGDAFESSLVASTSHAIVPIDVDIVLTSATIDDVPELQDRILVATAKSLGVPLLTSDRVIAGSKYAQFIR